MARSRRVGRTAELVGDMWDQTNELPTVADRSDPLADWAPAELSPAISARRRVRGPVVAAIITVVAVAAFALWWLPQLSDQRAADHAAAMRTALNGLYGDMAEVQRALAAATEPNSDVPDLGTVAADLAGAADSAARLLDVSSEPIPTPLPLASSQPFDVLLALRVDLGPLAAEASDLRTEVADIADYRLLFAKVLVVEELPLTADSATINAQAATLAESLANSVAALAAMPTEGPFAGHRTMVDTQVTAFARWQDDYLDALRGKDVADAERLVADLRSAQAALRNDLVAPLAQLRLDLDERILDLATRLADTIARVP